MKIIQTIKKKTIFTLTFMVLAAISFACSGVIETGVPADQVERIVAETMQAIPTDISPTSPPTATQTPASYLPPDRQQRQRFQPRPPSCQPRRESTSPPEPPTASPKERYRPGKHRTSFSRLNRDSQCWHRSVRQTMT